jgi:hypothetical protein
MRKLVGPQSFIAEYVREWRSFNRRRIGSDDFEDSVQIADDAIPPRQSVNRASIVAFPGFKSNHTCATTTIILQLGYLIHFLVIVIRLLAAVVKVLLFFVALTY